MFVSFVKSSRDLNRLLWDKVKRIYKNIILKTEVNMIGKKLQWSLHVSLGQGDY